MSRENGTRRSCLRSDEHDDSDVLWIRQTCQYDGTLSRVAILRPVRSRGRAPNVDEPPDLSVRFEDYMPSGVDHGLKALSLGDLNGGTASTDARAPTPARQSSAYARFNGATELISARDSTLMRGFYQERALVNGSSDDVDSVLGSLYTPLWVLQRNQATGDFSPTAAGVSLGAPSDDLVVDEIVNEHDTTPTGTQSAPRRVNGEHVLPVMCPNCGNAHSSRSSQSGPRCSDCRRVEGLWPGRQESFESSSKSEDSSRS